MEIAEHITIVAGEGKAFAVAARRGDLDAPVPSCPGWNTRDLVRHLAEIHLWAAARVAKRTTKLWLDDLSELTESWPDLAVFWPDDDDLIDFYVATSENLVDALESAPADLDCPTFLPAPSPLAMWARRQAHETSVHRFDAELAAGHPSGFEPHIASDGIDEILAAFAPRGKDFPVESPKTMLVHARDTDDRWHVTLSPDGITTERGDGEADVLVAGDASDLYLVLWNRAEDSTVSVSGESEILNLWHGNHRLRWTS